MVFVYTYRSAYILLYQNLFARTLSCRGYRPHITTCLQQVCRYIIRSVASKAIKPSHCYIFSIIYMYGSQIKVAACVSLSFYVHFIFSYIHQVQDIYTSIKWHLHQARLNWIKSTTATKGNTSYWTGVVTTLTLGNAHPNFKNHLLVPGRLAMHT